MGLIPERIIEALDVSANTVTDLAWELRISREQAERGVEECVRRGWVVRPMPAAPVPMPWGWAPLLVLTAQGEEALAETGAAGQ